MDSIDDDFGELYADVEVQVKSITNNAQSSLNFILNWNRNQRTRTVRNEDFKRFPVTGGGSGFNEDDDSFDQVQHRPHGSNFPNNLRVNGSTGMSSFSSLSARGYRKDNACNQHKCLNSGKVASISASSKIHQHAYSFSLPWYTLVLGRP
ncbi:hypothetical protein Q3G72_025344 [Acer saccharum]|nr:hypothetical protein Q3G72_025344 [Acer saccharum]